MKKFFIILMFINGSLLFSNDLCGQAPEAIPYQAVARNYAGNPLMNQSISLRFSIHNSDPSGTIIFQETHNLITNHLGLFTVNIGQGLNLIGSFDDIDWGIDAKFMQVEIDTLGGDSYLDMGTQQMLSVPYALYARSSGNLPTGSALGNTLWWNGTSWNEDFAIFNNGTNVGIGTSTPEFKLSVGNANPFALSDGGIMAKGIYNSGNTLTTSGAGVRMFWYPRKAAFRAGEAAADEWDDANVNYGSVAMGYANKADGYISTAFGISNRAGGLISTAFGGYSQATGDYSTAIGNTSIASGFSAIAAGNNNIASGYAALALGNQSNATGDNSVAIGGTCQVNEFTVETVKALRTKLRENHVRSKSTYFNNA